MAQRHLCPIRLDTADDVFIQTVVLVLRSLETSWAGAGLDRIDLGLDGFGLDQTLDQDQQPASHTSSLVIDSSPSKRHTKLLSLFKHKCKHLHSWFICTRIRA